MALIILGATRCPLCDTPLEQGQACVATTHFIGDQSDPLWRFSDAGMHRACFDQWEHRDEFAQRYRTTMTGAYPKGDPRGERYRNWPDP